MHSTNEQSDYMYGEDKNLNIKGMRKTFSISVISNEKEDNLFVLPST